MKNPWNEIDLKTYEDHMSSSEVMQIQMLNRIMKRQFSYNKPVVMVLGAAGGNGLEYAADTSVKKIYAVDINSEYLVICKKRYSYLQEKLEIIQCDLSDESTLLPPCGNLICNLIIEYLGIEKFVQLISKNSSGFEIISCVIQKNNGNYFVSNSLNSKAFDCLQPIHQIIDEHMLVEKMNGIGFSVILRETYNLPDCKEFIRIDFKSV